MDELRKTKEEKMKGKVIISVKKLDENGEEISNKVYEDPTVIMMIMEPEQPNDGKHVAVNGIIQGIGRELYQMANELTSEFEKKGLLRDRNPLADLFAGLFGGSGSDEEDEHEHKCSDCAINDTCELDPAVEFRAKNDQPLN